MQTSNVNPKMRRKNSQWRFLAEYSLSDFFTNPAQPDKVTSGWLFQTGQELGIPPEYVANIEITLKGFTGDASIHFKPGEGESPGLIRIFCQEHLKADASPKKTSLPCHSEPGTEFAPAVPCSSMKMSGGWGYFLVERSADSSVASSGSPQHFVDLYLYQEVE